MIPAVRGYKQHILEIQDLRQGLVCIVGLCERYDIKLTNKPLEHFLANPFNGGGDELTWETKIIIPFE
jgi:hypothetical protein